MENKPALTDVYLTFCGFIDQNTVSKILHNFATAINMNVKHIHLLFQSTGGIVNDGICLYNYFKSLPCDVTLYNVGSVQSIATISYLGAKHRKTSANATFMIHRTTAGTQFAGSSRLHSLAKSVFLDDQRTEAIIKSHVKLSADQWAELNVADVVFSGEESVKLGLSQTIGEFSPPPGTQIYNISY